MTQIITTHTNHGRTLEQEAALALPGLFSAVFLRLMGGRFSRHQNELNVQNITADFQPLGYLILPLLRRAHTRA